MTFSHDMMTVLVQLLSIIKTKYILLKMQTQLCIHVKRSMHWLAKTAAQHCTDLMFIRKDTNPDSFTTF